MSLTPHNGLLGVSSQTSRVAPGLTAARNAAKSSQSQNVASSPKAGASTASQLRSAQYITRGATICAPGAKLKNSAIAADEPEPNSSVEDAPSSAPTTCSPSRTVALSGRP